MLTLKTSKTLFIFSNILYFCSILFTYLDLKKFKIENTVYPNQFSPMTYTIILMFLINLFFLYICVSKDKFKIFNIFVYYLVLSAGVYVLNFPMMDELILISSSIFFSIQFISNKKILFYRYTLLPLTILIILFIQSIMGLLHDFRSVRYIFIFLSLIISFLYFSDLQEIDNKKHIMFIRYIFYAIVIYMLYQFFFWFLKFYVFEMRFPEQKFIGDMQPSFAKSSSGHFDAIHIFSGYLILYFSNKAGFTFKSIILFSLILVSWVLADARSSLFLICSVGLFYFLYLNFKRKIVFIFFLTVLIFQSTYFNNSFNFYIEKVKNITTNILDFKQGTEKKIPLYKLESGEFYYKETVRSAYPDFGRLSYALSAINSINYSFDKIIFGCGFYGFYYCADKAIKDIYDKYDIPLEVNAGGFAKKKIRPPAFGTIFVENGLILIFLGIFYYIRSLKKNILVRRGILIYNTKIIFQIYFFFTIVSWTFFSNILDIICIYLFLFKIFRKFLFFKD